jgi:sulfate adenylyltransferase subunit 1 (EFTu-like GTPase family)
VARIVTFDGDLQEAGAGEAITLVLKDEIDISRGDLLVDAQETAGGAKRQRGRGVDGRAAADAWPEL